jgi:hypothetical protein
MKFTGTDNYVATQDLMLAVNAGSGTGAGHAPAAMAHQIDHQGSAGFV